MKLTKEQKAKLGIEFDGDDVPESELLKAAETFAARTKEFEGVNLEDLKAKAGQTETLLTAKREEVTRVAKLAELGADEQELPEVISMQIENADADMLVKLEDHYRKKAANKFPPSGRSSFEDSKDVENAGNVNNNKKPVKLPKLKR